MAVWSKVASVGMTGSRKARTEAVQQFKPELRLSTYKETEVPEVWLE